MDGFDDVVGIGRDDGDCLEGVAIVLPAVPEAGERERVVIFEADPVGLLVATLAFYS
jgi:hypothetical protein